MRERLHPMIHQCYCSVAVVVVVVLCGCEDGDSIPNITLPASQQSHDLGMLFVTPEESRSLVLSHPFEITNEVDDQMELQFLGGSCGCATPLIKKSTLAPGESCRVEMKINALGRSGHQREYTVIGTGIEEVPEIRLTLSAQVVPRLETTGLPTDYYHVRRGGSNEFTFHVHARRPLFEPAAALKLERVESDQFFSAELGRSEQREIGDLYALTKTEVRLRLGSPKRVENPDQPIGRRVLSFSNGHAELQQVIVWVADVPIQTEPSRVFLKRTPNAEASHAVRLTAAEAFSITEVKVPKEELRVEVSTDLSQVTHALRVSACGPWLDGRSRIERFHIRIRTDHPEHEIVCLPVLVLNAR